MVEFLKITSKIVQILPADGWSAGIKKASGEFEFPLACWALINHPDGTTTLEGMVSNGPEGLCSAQSSEKFTGYVRSRLPVK